MIQFDSGVANLLTFMYENDGTLASKPLICHDYIHKQMEGFSFLHDGGHFWRMNGPKDNLISQWKHFQTKSHFGPTWFSGGIQSCQT